MKAAKLATQLVHLRPVLMTEPVMCWLGFGDWFLLLRLTTILAVTRPSTIHAQLAAEIHLATLGALAVSFTRPTALQTSVQLVLRS